MRSVTRWEIEAWSTRESIKVCIGAPTIPMKRTREILDSGKFKDARIYKVVDDIRTLVRIVDGQPQTRGVPWWRQEA